MSETDSHPRGRFADAARTEGPTRADQALRDAFDRAGVANCQWGLRVFCGFALALLAASTVDSWFSERPIFASLLRIRLSAAAALAVIVIASGTRVGRARARLLALGAVLVMSVTLHALAQETGGEASPQYDRMTLVMLGTAIMMSWGPLWAAVACGIVLAVFTVGSVATAGVSTGPFMANIGRLFAAGVVTISANTIRERRRWRDTLNDQALVEARAATRQSRLEYDSLMETAGSAILVLSPDRRIVEFNRGAEAIFGYRRDEVLGKDYFALFRPDLSPEDIASVMARASAGEEIRGRESEVRVRGGAHRFILWNIARLSGPEDTAPYIGVGQDITDRIRAEDEIRRLNAELEQRVLARTAELRESEERFRTMFEAAPIGVVTVDASGVIAQANPAFQQMLGYDMNALRQRSIYELTGADDRARTINAYALLRRGRKAHVQLDKRYVHRTGASLWVHEAVASIHDARGDFVFALAMVDDVSERKRSEDRAREHGEQLAHVLRVSTMGELAAQLAHEINQPLGAIVNYANGIGMRLREHGMDAPALSVAVGHIASEAHRAAEIIRRMRDFIRRGEVRREWADGNEVVREAARFAEPDARRHGIPLRLVLADGLPMLEMDRIQVVQVVLNLVRNGIEAMARSGDEDNELLVQTACADGAGIEVSVRDTGTGVPAAQTERIFEPFFTTKVSGLGMGLSISRSIIEAHGGRLWAAPNRDRGTTFSFILPGPDRARPGA